MCWCNKVAIMSEFYDYKFIWQNSHTGWWLLLCDQLFWLQIKLLRATIVPHIVPDCLGNHELLPSKADFLIYWLVEIVFAKLCFWKLSVSRPKWKIFRFSWLRLDVINWLCFPKVIAKFHTWLLFQFIILILLLFNHTLMYISICIIMLC